MLCGFSRSHSRVNKTIDIIRPFYRQMSQSLPNFDYVVIGAGSGGIASARRAASYGAKVAVIERVRLGGTCVNVGCVPKKVMWSAAAIGHGLEDAEEYCWSGVDLAKKNFDWSKMKEKRDAYIKRLNGIYYNNLAKDNITIIRGVANFVNDSTLEVLPLPDVEEFKAQDAANNQTQFTYAVEGGIKFNIGSEACKTVLVACGGAPSPLEIPGGELAQTSDDFFAASVQPKKVCVVGAGYIAVELAHIFHALGTETTLAVRKATALSNFDDIIKDTLWNQLSKTQGFTALNHHVPSKIVKEADGTLTITFKTADGEKDYTGYDAVYSAVGRKAGALLNLDATSAAMDKRGTLTVDDMGQTSLPNVFAVGDVLGKSDLTPVAIQAGRRLSDWKFGGKPKDPVLYYGIPTVVFTYPPIGVVGLTEQEAEEKFGKDDIRVWKTQFTPMYYSMLTNKGTCVMKLITQGAEEVVIGIHLMGPGVDEMLQGFAAFVRCGLTKKQLDSVIAIHPTASEELVLFR